MFYRIIRTPEQKFTYKVIDEKGTMVRKGTELFDTIGEAQKFIDAIPPEHAATQENPPMSASKEEEERQRLHDLETGNVGRDYELVQADLDAFPQLVEAGFVVGEVIPMGTPIAEAIKVKKGE